MAAGGIFDGRGLAAALTLGADGIWVGTRFIATPEARSSPGYKDALVKAAEDRIKLLNGQLVEAKDQAEAEKLKRLDEEKAKVALKKEDRNAWWMTWVVTPLIILLFLPCLIVLLPALFALRMVWRLLHKTAPRPPAFPRFPVSPFRGQRRLRQGHLGPWPARPSGA